MLGKENIEEKWEGNKKLRKGKQNIFFVQLTYEKFEVKQNELYKIIYFYKNEENVFIKWYYALK